MPFTGTSCNCPPLPPLIYAMRRASHSLVPHLAAALSPGGFPRPAFGRKGPSLVDGEVTRRGPTSTKAIGPHPTPLAAAALSSAPGLGETLQGPSSALEGPRLPLWEVHQVGEGALRPQPLDCSGSSNSTCRCRRLPDIRLGHWSRDIKQANPSDG